MTTEQRLPHEIVPAPNPDTGTAAQWSTYHLVRACAYSKLIEHLIHVDDNDGLQAAVNGFIGQFAISHLLDKVSDDDARELEALLAAGDVADELTWERLAARGIDPDTVRRFTSRAEHVAQRLVTAPESLRERVARAICESDGEVWVGDWGPFCEGYRKNADAVITVMRGDR